MACNLIFIELLASPILIKLGHQYNSSTSRSENINYILK